MLLTQKRSMTLKFNRMKHNYKATARNIRVLLGKAAILLVAIAMTAPLNAQVTVTQKGNLKVGDSLWSHPTEEWERSVP